MVPDFVSEFGAFRTSCSRIIWKFQKVLRNNRNFDTSWSLHPITLIFHGCCLVLILEIETVLYQIFGVKISFWTSAFEIRVSIGSCCKPVDLTSSWCFLLDLFKFFKVFSEILGISSRAVSDPVTGII
ncbi:hypothetical protein AVEN_100100-1 [Araneus ventricosus]|uniref:Uncharacterized protein n=1 Tax=Araneus ventricosus TaxID=182803 RepID=A0A4Y2QXL4_ARAVE|nr:hypothetical protein AVEN_100100-1 [Araneus ventricosus]